MSLLIKAFHGRVESSEVNRASGGLSIDRLLHTAICHSCRYRDSDRTVCVSAATEPYYWAPDHRRSGVCRQIIRLPILTVDLEYLFQPRVSDPWQGRHGSARDGICGQLKRSCCSHRRTTFSDIRSRKPLKRCGRERQRTCRS